ncbi:acetoacetate--CoA ligase [Paracoccus sp. 228]|uniref:acetoacetate--CoA ligase n=1 Tax=Paracoccus sp. 228 TaxID=1192054 RepID=UPI0005DB209A|nr:acetoacetate--CoA ligase [Paracoccus sp. 228]KIX16281.1 acetoacetyl-CoA synthase [Paracoccus sp. 228]
MTDSSVLWRPSDTAFRDSALARFAQECGMDPFDYEALHGWSISEPGMFWSRLWDFAEVKGDKGAITLERDSAAPMTGARFFPQARLNIAETLLAGANPKRAVVELDESGSRVEMSADALRAEVARIARGLRDAGVMPGDRVGVVLPNRIGCLVTHLASLAVGAVWTSCSPDFGSAGILDRIGQVNPKVMFVQPHVRYGGKQIDLTSGLTDLLHQIGGLHAVVTIGDGDLQASVPVTSWEDFGTDGPLVFEPRAFDDPCYILYTSGTTGAPKAIVHRTGGVLLQQLKEHMLHGDLRRGDSFMWYTNTAWMMYHWAVAGMGCGATTVLYDGAPVLKGADGLDCSPLWRAVETEGLTHLGISPKYLSTVMEQGYRPGEAHDLSSLRWLMSAGSPVSPRQYDWMYDAVSADMGFASISGGTEIMGCFLLGSPLHPVHRGRLTVKGLGMAVNVFDERGAPVLGRPGELVCTEPFPSMPRTFWGPDGDARYRKSYFSERAEIWTHGDHATLYPDGTAVIHGRSDCTLNPGGVRIGTADIYNVCAQFPQLEDCIVFGRPVEGDEEIVLCIKMAGGAKAEPDLAKAIRSRLRTECSPRHVPSAIYAVADIPMTVNGKRVEGAARSMVVGTALANRGSLANADCLHEYAALSERVAL